MEFHPCKTIFHAASFRVQTALVKITDFRYCR